MTKKYKLTKNTKVKCGRTLYQIKALKSFGSVNKGDLGGWVESYECLSQDGEGWVYEAALVFRCARIYGGVFYNGLFYGGVFYNGVFYGGEFRGGVFYGGEFRGGVFYGGEFRGGEFRGGEFRGGVFRKSPSCAQRSDGYMFVAKVVSGSLRIWAGCRNFSWDEAVKHWGNPEHYAHAESMRIINFLKEQEEANVND